jgi:predicted RNase H-like nuclease (RuvC/YqgF family)
MQQRRNGDGDVTDETRKVDRAVQVELGLRAPTDKQQQLCHSASVQERISKRRPVSCTRDVRAQSGSTCDVIRDCQSRLQSFVDDYKSRVEQLAQEVASREAEVKRLSAERYRLRDRLVESRGRENELLSVVADLEQCLDDLRGKVNEATTMSQLEQLEYGEMVYALTRKLHQMSSENRWLRGLVDSAVRGDVSCPWPRPPPPVTELPQPDQAAGLTAATAADSSFDGGSSSSQ